MYQLSSYTINGQLRFLKDPAQPLAPYTLGVRDSFSDEEDLFDIQNGDLLIIYKMNTQEIAIQNVMQQIEDAHYDKKSLESMKFFQEELMNGKKHFSKNMQEEFQEFPIETMASMGFALKTPFGDISDPAIEFNLDRYINFKKTNPKPKYKIAALMNNIHDGQDASELFVARGKSRSFIPGKNKNIIFAGIVDLDYTQNQVETTMICGDTRTITIDGVQKGFEPKVWANLFTTSHAATVIKPFSGGMA